MIKREKVLVVMTHFVCNYFLQRILCGSFFFDFDINMTFVLVVLGFGAFFIAIDYFIVMRLMKINGIQISIGKSCHLVDMAIVPSIWVVIYGLFFYKGKLDIYFYFDSVISVLLTSLMLIERIMIVKKTKMNV